MEQEEKLNFMQMLSIMRVIDDDDRVKSFADCIEEQFQILSKKVSEYKRDGALTITMSFKYDQKSKNSVNVYAEVTKKIPKGRHCNMFYSDQRSGGLYLNENSTQLNWLNQNNKVHPIKKDAAAQND